MIHTHYNTKILQWYRIKKKDIKKNIKEIMYERRRLNLPVLRDNKSYERELRSHIRMYKLHIFRKHTEDCDLETKIKKWKEIVYFIIGI